MFHLAQRFGHTTIVSLLLEAGADWQHEDCTGRTALEWAKVNEENVKGAEDAAAVLGAWAASVELRDELARHTSAATVASNFEGVPVIVAANADVGRRTSDYQSGVQ